MLKDIFRLKYYLTNNTYINFIFCIMEACFLHSDGNILPIWIKIDL